MRSFQRINLFIVICFLLASCGEGFRSHGLEELEESMQSPSTDSSDDFLTRLPDFEQSSDPFREIFLEDYQFQMSEAEARNVRQTISALDIVLIQDSANSYTFHGRIMVDCGEAYLITRQISNLQRNEIYSLGRGGDFELEFQCVNSNCSRIAVAIDKFRGPNWGMVLSPMAVSFDQSRGLGVYTGIDIGLTPLYTAFPNIATYEQARNCTFTEAAGVSDAEDENESQSLAEQLGRALLEPALEDVGVENDNIRNVIVDFFFN
jgi:hypothetical protein